jgi:hypothetical protein
MRHRRRIPARTAPALAALLVVALAACGEGSATEAGIGPGADRTDATTADATPTTAGPTATSAADEPAGSGAGGDRYVFVGTVLEDGGAAPSGAHGPELCVGAIMDSFPPQCGGVALAEWSWDGVPGVRSQSGTTWADMLRVVGTYDGETFTPTEAPTAADPADAAGAYVPDLSPACEQPTLGDPALMAREHFDAGTAAANARPDLAAVWVDDQGPATDWLLNVEVTGDAAGAEAAVRQSWGGRLCTVAVPERPTSAELAAVQEQLPDALGVTVWASAPDTLAGNVRAQVTVLTDELQARADEAFGPGMVVLEGTLRPA